MAEGKAEATAKSGVKVATKGLNSGTKVLTGFRDFILRGNVVDLAVAIVVGTAFTAVVKALVTDIITPFIAAIWGGPFFGDLYFTINRSKFLYGDFLNSVCNVDRFRTSCIGSLNTVSCASQVITFLVICIVVYFVVVVPMNMALNKLYPKAPKVKCPECLEEIIKGATRCKWCTTHIDPASALPVPNQDEVTVKAGETAPVPAERQAAAEKPISADTNL